MGRWPSTIPKLDQAHATLREHPGITPEEFTKVLAHAPCHVCKTLAGSSLPWEPARCYNCHGTGSGPVERQTAYGWLRKLEDDGRARCDRGQAGGVGPGRPPYRWYAIVDDETEALDAWFEELGDQAPTDELAAEFHRLSVEREKALDAAAEALDRMDELMREAYAEEGTMKAAGARLGVTYTAISYALKRLFERRPRR